MKIGILLALSPERQDGFTVVQLSRAFLEKGDDVHIFLVDDGVYNAVSSNPRSGSFAGLISMGGKISLCSQTATERGLSEGDILEGVNRSSLYALATIAGESDRFLSFSK